MKVKIVFLLSFFCMAVFQNYGVCSDVPTPEELIDLHLKAIGEPKALSYIKSIGFWGASDVEFIQGMRGKMLGTSMLLSQGNKICIALGFSDTNYEGEYFAYDGKDVTVKNVGPGVKTPLADFLFTYNKIMKNGMLGGIFSNAWPLLNIKRSKPTYMNVRSTRLDGKDVYELEYRPKDRHGDMKIRMFFETDTYRHIRTEYKVSLDNDASHGTRGETNNVWAVSGMVTGSTIFTLTEKFDDFKEIGFLTLPHSYAINYDLDGIARAAFIGRWNLKVKEIAFNAEKVDPKIFKAEK